MRKILFIGLALILSLGLILTACTEEEKEVTVGCKNFTEQYIVGEMIKQLLEDRDFTVNYKPDLATDIMRNGMEAGDIDICSEYTGTAWSVHLGEVYEPGVDNYELYELVKEADEANDFIWLDAIWNNNTYAFASWPEFVEENDVESLSDLAALYNEKEGKITMFTTIEFSTRPDGLPGLEDHYNFTVDEGSILTGDYSICILALEGKECEVGMVFGTEPKVAVNGWRVYQDDKAYFAPYDIVPSVRKEVLDKYPELEDILNELVATFPGGGKMATPAIVGQCQSVWQELIAKVDIDKMEPEEVAEEYLKSKGLID
jgi:osmoprotectant transport system substrate-binding protein